jgi:hypothetical protein
MIMIFLDSKGIAFVVSSTKSVIVTIGIVSPLKDLQSVYTSMTVLSSPY